MRAIRSGNYNRSAIAIAVGMAISGVAYSQDAPAGDGLEEVVVTGTRATLANALARQRAANTVASVVDSDAAGDFADINVSESLRRLPGIMVENDQGEGRYVSVRGMNADLNAMTINGVSTASPENRRGIMLDGVPTDMLESMTVYKTLTPNLDADTIGGAIDLETVTAFKYDGMNVRLKAETSYNDLSEDAGNPKLALMASNRWQMGDGEFGAALTVSQQQRRIVSLNNETGGWGSGVALDTDYEMRFYDIERERQGVVLNLDYRGDSGSKYYGRFLWNEYTDTEDRAKWETRRSLEAPATVNGNVFTYPFQRIDSESRPRVEVRNIASAQIGGEFQLGERSTLRAEVFGSQAEQDDTDKWNVIFRSRQLAVPQIYDNTNPRQPVLPFDPALYVASNFSLNAFETEIALTDDEDIGFRLDMTFKMNEATELQYGVKLRQREKNNDFNFCGYEPVTGSTLANYDNRTLAPYFGSVPGPLPTYAGTRALIPTLGTGVVALSDGTTCPSPGANWDLSGDEDAESIAADWYTEEDVASGYVMATTTTERATWVYGLRYEDTRARYSGKQFDGDAFAGRVSFDNDYGFLAPSLNIKYNLADDKILRFGLFRSLIRPGFGEAAAGAEINLDDNEISGGNPGLAPTKAWNLDLGFEWYIGNETYFGAGLFYKDLQDPIVAVEANDVQLRGRLWDLAETFINTEDSSIWGAELAFQTVFRNGFLVTFNYTYADGETDLPADSAFGVRTIPFFKQAQSTVNASIGYDKGPWDLRLSANYRDDYLDAIGSGPLSDRYTSDFMQVDLKGKYELNDNLTLSAAVINLNDRPEYYYFGNRSRLSQYDEFGTTYEVGFTYTF
jgi:TonB-dependent receptor